MNRAAFFLYRGKAAVELTTRRITTHCTWEIQRPAHALKSSIAANIATRGPLICLPEWIRPFTASLHGMTCRIVRRSATSTTQGTRREIAASIERHFARLRTIQGVGIAALRRATVGRRKLVVLSRRAVGEYGTMESRHGYELRRRGANDRPSGNNRGSQRFVDSNPTAATPLNLHAYARR